jgi:hypothetical protein
VGKIERREEIESQVRYQHVGIVEPLVDAIPLVK